MVIDHKDLYPYNNFCYLAVSIKKSVRSSDCQSLGLVRHNMSFFVDFFKLLIPDIGFPDKYYTSGFNAFIKNTVGKRVTNIF